MNHNEFIKKSIVHKKIDRGIESQSDVYIYSLPRKKHKRYLIIVMGPGTNFRELLRNFRRISHKEHVLEKFSEKLNNFRGY